MGLVAQAEGLLNGGYGGHHKAAVEVGHAGIENAGHRGRHGRHAALLAGAEHHQFAADADAEVARQGRTDDGLAGLLGHAPFGNAVEEAHGAPLPLEINAEHLGAEAAVVRGGKRKGLHPGRNRDDARPRLQVAHQRGDAIDRMLEAGPINVVLPLELHVSGEKGGGGVDLGAVHTRLNRHGEARQAHREGNRAGGKPGAAAVAPQIAPSDGRHQWAGGIGRSLSSRHGLSHRGHHSAG